VCVVSMPAARTFECLERIEVEAALFSSGFDLGVTIGERNLAALELMPRVIGVLVVLTKHDVEDHLAVVAQKFAAVFDGGKR